MNELLRRLLESFGVNAEAPDYSQLSDAKLPQMHSRVLQLFDQVRDAGEDEPVDVAGLREIADVSDALLAEDEVRQEAAEAAQGEVAELEQRIRPAVEEEDPEAVAAGGSGGVRGRRVSLDALGRHRRGSQVPSRAAHAAAGSGGEARFVAQVTDRVGEVLDRDGVAEVLARAAESSFGGRGAQRVIVAQARTVYPDGRELSETDWASNQRAVDAVVASAREGARTDRSTSTAGDFESLVAAGGLCAPLTVRYEQDTVGTDSRPVRSGLPTFGAPRGGIRQVLPPMLVDVRSGGPNDDAAVGIWTEADDIAALDDDGPRKPIQRVVCGDEVTVKTVAVPLRLLVGNQLALTFPERVRAFIDLALVRQARVADGRLSARIKSMSTQVAQEGQVLGSRRDILVAARKAAWAVRNRERMSNDEPLQALFPDAVIEQALTDGVRQVPGDQRDRMTREEFVGELRAMGIDPIITPDMPGHLAPVQAAEAQLVDLPSPIEWGIWPLGTFGFLDQGDLNLGFASGTPIRDSDLNAANDHELFAEGFEEVTRFLGLQSLWVRSYVCPTGTTSGTTDVDCDDAS